MSKKVTVYSTPTCPYCMGVKKFLEDNNIVFEEYNVAKEHDKAEEMKEKSGQMGVPVLDIDGEIIVGFDKDGIRKALDI